MTSNRPTGAWVPLERSVVMYASGRLLRGHIVDVTATTLRVRCAPGYSLHALLGAQLELEVRIDRFGGQRRLSGCAAQVRSDRDLVIVLDGDELLYAGGLN